jgi:hypothetical protein
MNRFLVICCLAVASSSFQLGYNVSPLNPCTRIVQSFVKENLFLFERFNKSRNLTETAAANMNETTQIYWVALNTLFILGGLVGAVSSKLGMDRLSRRHFLLMKNCFSIAGGVLTLLAKYLSSPVCLLIGRPAPSLEFIMA